MAIKCRTENLEFPDKSKSDTQKVRFSQIFSAKRVPGDRSEVTCEGARWMLEQWQACWSKLLQRVESHSTG